MNPHNPDDKDQAIARLTALVGKMREEFDRIRAYNGPNPKDEINTVRIFADLALSLSPADMGEWVRKEEFDHMEQELTELAKRDLETREYLRTKLAEVEKERECLRESSAEELSAKARIAELEAALWVCAERFQTYALLHAAKGTEDGNRKAAANAKLARMCEAVLAKKGAE